MTLLKKQLNDLYKVENMSFANWPHHRSIKKSIEELINKVDGKLGDICYENLDTELQKCNEEQVVYARNVILYLKADHLLAPTTRQRRVLDQADYLLNRGW